MARATGLALSIDATFGLGVEGPVWHNAPEALLLREPATRARIEAAEDRATAILALNRGLLEGMAEALLAARELDQAAAEVWLNSVTGAFAGPTRDPETRS